MNEINIKFFYDGEKSQMVGEFSKNEIGCVCEVLLDYIATHEPQIFGTSLMWMMHTFCNQYGEEKYGQLMEKVADIIERKKI